MDRGSLGWAASPARDTFDKLYLWNLTEYAMVAFFDADMLALDEPDSVFNFPLPNETFVGALGSGVPSKSRPRWRNPDPQRRAGGGVSFSVIEWKLKRHEGAVALRSESRRGAFVVGLAAAMQQLGDHLVRHPPPQGCTGFSEALG